ncbi:hypothetical protein HU200_011248 [Digitaria exilis]|uniref:Uncharacterized protein n=1 Tax=Digitaria exilis TaxID=1010633 RepID=A0A835KPA0_9POAL|nr:hypothetical protein HU200_011248 [Digitaria exilis]
MFGGRTRVCRRSMIPLRLLVLGDTGDAEATALQGNNFYRLFSFSGGDLLRRQWRGQGDLCWSPGPAHHCLLQVMMLLTRLIPRNMISSGNPSFARVVGVGFEDCVVGPELADVPGTVYLASAPSSKSSSAASTLWRLVLASSDNWEAVWMVVTNGSVKSSRKIIRSFKLLCNFRFFLVFVCKRVGVTY